MDQKEITMQIIFG